MALTTSSMAFSMLCERLDLLVSLHSTALMLLLQLTILATFSDSVTSWFSSSGSVEDMD